MAAIREFFKGLGKKKGPSKGDYDGRRAALSERLKKALTVPDFGATLKAQFAEAEKLAKDTDYGGAMAALDELERTIVLAEAAAEKQRVLVAAQAKYSNEKRALEDGDLKKVPATAPKGLEGPHGAVGAAKSKLPASVTTVEGYGPAERALEALGERVKEYLQAEALALGTAKSKYDGDKRALENGDLRKVPATSPKGLEAKHRAVIAAKGLLPADPKTLTDYADAATKLEDLTRKVAEYRDAVKRAKDACEVEYDKVIAVYKEADKAPAIPALRAAIAEHQAAYNAFLDEYAKGEYVTAGGLLATVKAKSQAVIGAVASTGATARQEISAGQLGQANAKLDLMSATDKKAVEELITAAPTDKHKDNLRKAVASGHTAEEIAAFAAKIRDKDETWIQDNLHIAAKSNGTGVQQQFIMSCQATMVQAVKAELDPIYALKLHEENPDITKVGGSDTITLAREQKQMLESAPEDESVRATHQASATARMNADTPENKRALEELLATATTNWEKNELLEMVGDANNYTPVALKNWFDRDVKGKGGGKAVHLSDTSGDIGEGRRGVDLLNKNKDVTGLKYETKFLDASSRGTGVDDISAELSLGRPVPLSVGSTDGELAHYVLAVSVIAGPPKTFVIHDPGSGTTVLRTDAQLKNNQMDLPSGWSHLNKYEKPSAV